MTYYAFGEHIVPIVELFEEEVENQVHHEGYM